MSAQGSAQPGGPCQSGIPGHALALQPAPSLVPSRRFESRLTGATRTPIVACDGRSPSDTNNTGPALRLCPSTPTAVIAYGSRSAVTIRLQ